MQEMNAQAAMVPTADLRGGLATIIPRAEVEEALRSDEPPELILDITRGEETRSVAVAWKREDLARLLNEATSDQIELTFDRATIEEAMDADVEAHGFREKALVLAVAFAAAAGTAGAASAMPLDTGGGAGSAVHLVGGAGGGAAVEPGGAGGGAAVEPGGAGGGGAHLGDVTGGGGQVLTGLSGPSGVHLGDTTGGGGEALTGLSGPSGVHLGDTTGGGGEALTGLSGPSGVHLGDTTGAGDALSGPSGVHLGDTTAASTPSGGSDEGFKLSDPGAGTAAVGGALALAITGAAFAFGGKRRLKPTT